MAAIETNDDRILHCCLVYKHKITVSSELWGNGCGGRVWPRVSLGLFFPSSRGACQKHEQRYRVAAIMLVVVQLLSQQVWFACFSCHEQM